MLLRRHRKKRIKILITGGYGFVGCCMFNFLKKNYSVYRFSHKIYNLSNFQILKKILIKYQPNIIIHLAARTVSATKTKKEDKLQYANTTLPVINLVNSIKYCNQLKKIIFFGTIEEYGIAKPPFVENAETKPVSSYGIAKAKALRYVKKKIDNKIKYIWLRPSLIFGKNDNKKRFLGSLFYSLKNNKKIKINVNSQIRDFLYVNDLCKFVELLVKKKNMNIKGNILNVTMENWVNLNYIFNYFSKKIQNKFTKLVVNSSSSKHIDYYSSGHLLKKHYKKFKFTDFKLALKKTFSVF
jgi:nucleoside-diphosphate-sugar epimerase